MWQGYKQVDLVSRLFAYYHICQGLSNQITLCSFCLSVVSLRKYITTVKHAHVVTSIKQSPVLKGHLFVFLSFFMY